jgi:hypothetical protein
LAFLVGVSVSWDGRRDWNGRLFTISSTSAENRYSLAGSRLAIVFTV